MKVTHLNMYDTRPWCEAEDPWEGDNDVAGSGEPGDPEDATCHACLDAVLKYAGRAMQRKFVLVGEYIATCKAKKDGE